MSFLSFPHILGAQVSLSMKWGLQCPPERTLCAVIHNSVWHAHPRAPVSTTQGCPPAPSPGPSAQSSTGHLFLSIFRALFPQTCLWVPQLRRGPPLSLLPSPRTAFARGCHTPHTTWQSETSLLFLPSLLLGQHHRSSSCPKWQHHCPRPLDRKSTRLNSSH